MRRLIETVVFGAAQTGLAISHYISGAGLAHVVPERSTAVANASRNRRRLIHPGDTEFSGAHAGSRVPADPYGFMSRVEIVAHLDSYMKRFRAARRTQLKGVAPDERWFGRQRDTEEVSQ